MRVLYCEECNETITEEKGGLKYNGLYFCSMECIDDYLNWYIDAIPGDDFERHGVETEPEKNLEDDEGEIVNDYDIQIGYAND